MFFFIVALLSAALLAYLITPLTRDLFIARGWIEDPRQKQQKTGNATALTSLPRGGGLPVFLAVLITSLILLPLDGHLLAILLAAFITLVIGLFDDVFDISPRLRLSFNFLAAALVVLSGIGIAYISNPLGGVINLNFFTYSFNFFGPRTLSLVPDLIAILWIVWLMNIVGWSAGVEGQMPGFVAVSAIFIGILAFRYATDIAEWPVIILAGAVAGAYLGFFPYNFFPQSIMVGYSGKSLAGFFLAVLAILSGAKLATLIFLLAVPIIDAIFVLTYRLTHRRPLLQGDNTHLHHRLLKLGWSRRRIALLYVFFSLLLGLISLNLNSQQKFYFLIGLFLFFWAFILTLSKHTSS